MSERRQDPRHEVPLIAYVQVMESELHEPGLTVSARVEEVSASGMRVSPAVQLDEGQVEMFVAIPSGERLFLAAEIRWSATDGETFETGLELINRDDTDISAWHAFAADQNRVGVAEVS